MIPKDRSVLITNLVVHCCTHLNKKIDMLKYIIVPRYSMIEELKCKKCKQALVYSVRTLRVYCGNDECSEVCASIWRLTPYAS